MTPMRKTSGHALGDMRHSVYLAAHDSQESRNDVNAYSAVIETSEEQRKTGTFRKQSGFGPPMRISNETDGFLTNREMKRLQFSSKAIEPRMFQMTDAFHKDQSPRKDTINLVNQSIAASGVGSLAASGGFQAMGNAISSIKGGAVRKNIHIPQVRSPSTSLQAHLIYGNKKSRSKLDAEDNPSQRRSGELSASGNYSLPTEGPNQWKK